MTKVNIVLRDQFMGWRASEVGWLIFCLVSMLSLSFWWHDSLLGIVAGATGVLYTVLAGKGKIICFLFGLINAPLYAYLSFENGYYGDCALSCYYTMMMVWGIFTWRHHFSKVAEEGVERISLSLRNRLVLIFLCLISILALWVLLKFIGGNRPFCDAITNVLSVAAMILTVRRAIEQWIFWTIVNMVEIFMWFRVAMVNGNDISVLLMWILFFANGLYLFRLWCRQRVIHQQ